MAKSKFILGLFLILQLSSLIVGQEKQDDSREPRSLRKRLCRRFGICQGGGGAGGFGGGYPGQGYPGQGYPGHIPAINIGISQSQSSSSAGGGGYSQGYYPNNQQYNQHRPGYNGFYPNQGYGAYGGYERPGYHGGNGFGSYNNQYNGNYYNPHGGFGGGYSFGGPFGFDDYSEESRPQYDETSSDGSDGTADSTVVHDYHDETNSASETYAAAERKA